MGDPKAGACIQYWWAMWDCYYLSQTSIVVWEIPE
jgi:hypothetical protein